MQTLATYPFLIYMYIIYYILYIYYIYIYIYIIYIYIYIYNHENKLSATLTLGHMKCSYTKIYVYDQ